MLVLVRAHAQTPPSTFQAEVNLIEVDTIVTDDQGHTVVGLTADDFELFDNGDPQKIVGVVVRRSGARDTDGIPRRREAG